MSNSRPQAASITRIVGTPALKTVYQAYEDARPVGLARSYVFAPAEAEAASSNGVVSTAYGNVKAGLIGQFLGFKGVAGYAAIKAADQCISMLKDWYNGKKTNDDLELVDFYYLQPLYNQLESNVNANVPEEERKRLQSLYDLLYQYQLQKMSRGWKSTGFGRNYRDDVIDDAKYLTAIFIGRKLVAAARAASADEYSMQMAHLQKFMAALPGNNGLFDTRSNDGRYLSLITTIEELQKSQFEAEKAKSRRKLLTQMQGMVDVLPAKCDDVLEQLKEQLLFAVTGITEQQYRQLNVEHFGIQQQAAISSLPQFEKVKNIFLDDKAPISSAHIAELLKEASGVSVQEDSASVQAINTLLEKRRALLAWNNILHRIKRFMNGLGVLGLSLELDNLRVVFEKMQNAYVEMFKARQDFVSTFGELKSRKMTFRQARLQYIYRPLNDGVLRQEMSSATNILAGISTEEEQKAISEEARLEIAGINQDINDLQPILDPAPCITDLLGQSLPAGVCKAKKVFEELESVDSEIEKKRVEQVARLEMQAESLTAELGNRILECDELKERVAVLEQENRELQELQIQPSAMAASSSSSQFELYDGIGMEEVWSPANTDFERKNAFSESVRELMAAFDFFIDQYKDHNQSSGFSLFKNHGRDGRIRADKIKAIWLNKSQAFKDVLESHVNDAETGVAGMYESVSKEIRKMIRSLMREPDLVEGNFHKHSLKTFIMSYYDGVRAFLPVASERSPFYAASQQVFESGLNEVTDVAAELFQSAYTDKVLAGNFSASKLKARWERRVRVAQDFSVSISDGFMSRQ